MICFKGSGQAEGQPAVTATQLEQGRTTPGDDLEISFSEKDDDDVGVVGDGVDGLGEERSYIGEDRQGDRSEVEGLLWWEGNA